MARTPQEIFGHHAEALMAGDMDGIVADYTDDAVYITPGGLYRGKDEVRRGYAELLGQLPDATLDVPRQIFEDDVLYLEWTAESPAARVTDGTDTIVFSADGIRVHTLHYTLQAPSS